MTQTDSLQKFTNQTYEENPRKKSDVWKSIVADLGKTGKFKKKQSYESLKVFLTNKLTNIRMQFSEVNATCKSGWVEMVVKATITSPASHPTDALALPGDVIAYVTSHRPISAAVARCHIHKFTTAIVTTDIHYRYNKKLSNTSVAVPSQSRTINK